MQKPIFLVGFMGCGKSHIGLKLADYLYCPFVDLDQQVEKKADKTINAIFAQQGEAWFRLLERRALHDTVSRIPGVIATGGGIPCYFNNIEWMNKHGLTIFLDTDEDVLFQRLWKGRAKRPLVRKFSPENLKHFIRLKMIERRPFYEKAVIHYKIKHHHQASAEEISLQLPTIVGH